MSLRERVRLLRKELCDEVIVELDRLEAEIAKARAQNELTHVAYVEENNRLMPSFTTNKDAQTIRDYIAWVKSLQYELLQDAEEIARLRNASDKIGSWLSAALEDSNVCDEMKTDIQNWFAALACRPQGEK